MPDCEYCEKTMSVNQAVVTVTPDPDTLENTAHVYCLYCTVSESVGPRALLQDGDQPATKVVRPHFWFLYISLLSGQCRLLMGQKRHSLTLGTFRGGVFDVTLPISPAVISLNRSLTEAAEMSMTASSP